MSSNIIFSKSNMSRFSGVALVAALAGAMLSGCASANPADAQQSTAPMAHHGDVHVADAWIKASPSGMTSGFAQLQNTGDKDLALVSVSSDIAGSIELHEMTGSGTSMSMTQLEGPLAIPANTTVTLEPGAQHIMLMDLKKELQAGTTATLLLTFADKSTQDVEFEIKEFSGAKESYAPDAEHQGHNEPGEHGDH